MGAFVAYTFQAGVLLLCGYLVYKWLLSSENQPAFNRVVLLTMYVLSFGLPAFIGFRLSFAPELSPDGGAVEIGTGVFELIDTPASEWATVLVWIYCIGASVALMLSVVGAVRLRRVLAGAERQRRGKYVLALLSDARFAPFSWCRYIAMSREDAESAGEMILIHEQAHLRNAHWVDLLFAQLVCIVLWYNPASWLMRDELRGVHEYQADSCVLRAGVDARQYQLLLIKKAVGQRFPSLANSLNHSKLKKRITMMCNPESGKSRRMRALAVVPALALALAVFNITAVASAVSKVSAAPLVESVGKVSEKVDAPQEQLKVVGQSTTDAKPAEVVEPEVRPAYPGGEAALYKFLGENIKYPSEAYKLNQQGRVVVQFMIEPDGSISNPQVVKSVAPLLDAEAIRIVTHMPKWAPGTVGGKPVTCTYTLPISFKLD